MPKAKASPKASFRRWPNSLAIVLRPAVGRTKPPRAVRIAADRGPEIDPSRSRPSVAEHLPSLRASCARHARPVVARMVPSVSSVTMFWLG
eukprot:6929836-Alexandrium_andersonii.AAC.1